MKTPTSNTMLYDITYTRQLSYTQETASPSLSAGKSGPQTAAVLLADGIPQHSGVRFFVPAIVSSCNRVLKTGPKC